MAVTAEDFLAFARDVLQGRSDEIGWRNVVSRAYYACFLSFREHAQLLDAVSGPYGSHEELLQRAKRLRKMDENHPDAPRSRILKKIAYDLNDFKVKRVKADYDLDLPCFQQQAQEAVQKAERVLVDLAKLGPPKKIL